MSQIENSHRQNDPLRLDSGDYASLAEKVFERLKRAIVYGELKPGDRLNERELARRMGTSTTTVKNAIHKLHIIGIVEVQPRRGTYVSDFCRTSIEEITTIRASLEGIAARFVAQKATDEDLERVRDQIARMQQHTDAQEYEELVRENTAFHEMLQELARSSYIAQLVKIVRSFDLPLRRRALIFPEEAHRGFEEHKSIADAIIARNPELAEDRMKNHVLRTMRFVMQELGQTTPG